MSHNNKNEDSLEAIKARDADLHYCRTCGNRVYDIGDEDDAHFKSLERCNFLLAEGNKGRVAAGKLPREPGGDGNLCWHPEEHHPFLEGPIPDYERAERDRRLLLGVYMEANEN